MDLLFPTALLVGGLVLLSFAADRFVTTVARLARHYGVPALLVGALVVGMGTSAPELLVSALAASAGDLDLAIGNAIGSNVANVTLVLGATAVITPVAGDLDILRREGALMWLAVVAFAVVLWDLEATRIEGIALIVGMFAAAALIVRWAKGPSRMSPSLPEEADSPVDDRLVSEFAIGIASLGATLLGAHWLVQGGSRLALAAGLSSSFVGMTIVAVGTSLPELATSIAGARRRESDLVLGNVLGSNLFNAFAVGGGAIAIHPGTLDPSFPVAAAAMVAAATVAGALAWSGSTIVRWEGALLLVGYAAFVYATSV